MAKFAIEVVCSPETLLTLSIGRLDDCSVKSSVPIKLCSRIVGLSCMRKPL